MKTFVDNKILHKITKEGDSEKYSFLEAGIKAGILKQDPVIQVHLSWPSLFNYLGLESLWEMWPVFDEKSELFTFLISTLALKPDKELLCRLYDQVFVECLTQLKAMVQIQPAFLIDQIRKRRSSPLFLQATRLFSSSLDQYEKSLVENPYPLMHDLTLYLAWDRVCVNFALIFEHASADMQTGDGLKIWKECLLESFQHITMQGKTVPGFFRLVETLYAYELRAENLYSHTDAEWLTLCQSSCALRPRQALSDILYIDKAMVNDGQMSQGVKEQSHLYVWTMDSADTVRASLALAQCIIKKLKRDMPEWPYTLCPPSIICLKQDTEGFLVDTVITT